MVNSIITILISFSVALVLTILIEWGLSYFILHSRHERELVVLAQCLTNPALNTILLINNYFGLVKPIILVIVLELLVIIIEAIIYKKGFKGTTINPYILSIGLNLASLSFGLLLNLIY